MQYYRNYELAKLYNVSRSAVGKWVESAKNGKLDLAMIDQDGKSYIAATSKNRAIMEKLVEERKKYFNQRSLKVITPRSEFYALFDVSQVQDMIVSLEVRGEIPVQYSYLGEGADRWDEYVNRRSEEGDLRSATFLAKDQLEMNRSYIDTILTPYTHVNVIDLGPGNALPVKELLGHLIMQDKLGRYLAIDISADMLEVARRNIQKWFGDEVPFEAEIRDITHERFGDLLLQNTDSHNVNLVVFLGGTLGNLDDPNGALQVIQRSLGHNDLLVYNIKLDTKSNRQVFDFFESMSIHSLALELLNIDKSLYIFEVGFDEVKRRRYAQIRLKVALSIDFKLPNGTHRVSFKKGETILLWHYRHQSAQEVITQFESHGFNVLQASQTPDHEFLLLICDVKTERT